MITGSRLPLYILIIALILPLNLARAQRIDLNSVNYWHSQAIDERFNYSCYKNPGDSAAPKFGLLNKRRNTFTALSRKKLKRNRRKVARKLKNLKRNKAAKLRAASSKKQRRKLKKKFAKKIERIKDLLQIIKNGASQCSDFYPYAPQDFSGEKYSLRKYREDLSEREVRNLLNKVAFGGDERLVEIGVTQGLTALVDELVSYQPDYQAQDLTDDPGPWITEYLGRSVVGVSPTEQMNFRFLMPHMLRGNPLKAFITYQLMDWFSVNLGTCQGSSIPDNCIFPYVNLYFSNALNFSGQALAGTFEHLANRQVTDFGMLQYLDNRYNTRTNLNENFGRELMELMLLGTHTLPGVPTYDQRSVIAATRSTTGYRTTWNGTEFWFDENRHDSGNKTIFPGLPWQATANFDHYSLVRYIIYNNPQSGHYIAGQFFTRFVHTEIGTDASARAFLEQLSWEFKNSGYHIGTFIKKLLMSSAMFSPEAYKPCIASPAESIIKMIRVTGMPAYYHGLELRDYYHDTYAYEAPNVLREMYDVMGDAGETLLQPHSIFGREFCGVWRSTTIHKGHNTLSVQNWLNRHNGFGDILKKIEDVEDFNYLTLLPSPQATSATIVSHFARIFNITLTAQEHSILSNYAAGFESMEDQDKITKVKGYLWLFFNHPDFAQR